MEVLPPEAISDMFNEVRDAAILKLAGQGPMAGLFRDLAYDADADQSDRQRRHGPEHADRVRKQCRDLGAGRRGRGMAGAGRPDPWLRVGLGSTGALTTLFAAVCGRSAELAGRVGEGMRTLGIDPGSLKVKLPGLDGESEEGERG